MIDSNRINEYFTTGYIEEVCERFSDTHANGESKREIKLS